MTQKQILLPQDVALRLHIAILQRDLAQAQARLMQSVADQQHLTTVTALLHAAQIFLPVPVTACAFDAEHGVLLYDDSTADNSATAE
jgi:hypothetical protein